jgi:hypothetical protein
MILHFSNAQSVSRNSANSVMKAFTVEAKGRHINVRIYVLSVNLFPHKNVALVQ